MHYILFNKYSFYSVNDSFFFSGQNYYHLKFIIYIYISNFKFLYLSAVLRWCRYKTMTRVMHWIDHVGQTWN